MLSYFNLLYILKAFSEKRKMSEFYWLNECHLKSLQLKHLALISTLTAVPELVPRPAGQLLPVRRRLRGDGLAWRRALERRALQLPPGVHLQERHKWVKVIPSCLSLTELIGGAEGWTSMRARTSTFFPSTAFCGPPPKVRNASIFGKTRQRYETNAVVRYHCAPGFRQRLSPLVRCLSGGAWERPKILCINGKN